ncbi:MAG: nucleotidyltransferase family protein [Sedimenticola sp.]
MSVENDLLLESLGTGDNREREKRVRALLNEDVDWTALAETALKHRVIPLLYHSFMRLPDGWVPEEILQAMGYFVHSRAEFSQDATRQLCAVLDALRQNGIEALPIKGPVLALQAYNQVGMRDYRDLDILVRKEDYPAVNSCLIRLGYKREKWKTDLKAIASWNYYGQDIFFHPQGHTSIEPHWLLAPSTFNIQLDFDLLSDRENSLSLNGLSMPVLSVENQLLVLCVHGCKEQWIYLRQICDLACLVVNNPELDWLYLLERASRNNCLRMLHIGLYLAYIMLGLPLPKVVIDSIKNDETAIELAGRVAADMFNDQRRHPDIYSVNRFRFRMRDRVRDAVINVVKTWSMPSDKHFKMVTLPRFLTGGYFIVKIIHDSLMLPAWRIFKIFKRKVT